MNEHQRTDQEQRRFEELHELYSRGINPYPHEFNRTHNSIYIVSHYSDDILNYFVMLPLPAELWL